MMSTTTAWLLPRRRARLGRAVVVIAGVSAGVVPQAQANDMSTLAELRSFEGRADSVVAGVKPSTRGGYIAKVLQQSTVRAEPNGQARAVGVVSNATSYLYQGTRLMIERAERDQLGRLWLRVQLPVRPNGSSGWLRADRVRIEHTRWSVRVRLQQRRLSVYRDGRLVRSVSTVVGAPATPTPRGWFAVYEVAPQTDKRGFTGPWALNLTSHSTTLENFGSGPGRVAIHGRGPESLIDPLGTARSHGCVRVSNATIDWMRQRLPNGTPVRITL